LEKALAAAAMKAKANRLHLAHQDMREAGDYANTLEESAFARDSDSAFFLFAAEEAIFIALIVVYACPFVNSFSSGKADPKVVPEDIRLFDNGSEFEILHGRIIDLRNTAVVHADWAKHHTVLIPDNQQYGLKREYSRAN